MNKHIVNQIGQMRSIKWKYYIKGYCKCKQFIASLEDQIVLCTFVHSSR